MLHTERLLWLSTGYFAICYHTDIKAALLGSFQIFKSFLIWMFFRSNNSFFISFVSNFKGQNIILPVILPELALHLIHFLLVFQHANTIFLFIAQQSPLKVSKHGSTLKRGDSIESIVLKSLSTSTRKFECNCIKQPPPKNSSSLLVQHFLRRPRVQIWFHLYHNQSYTVQPIQGYIK